MADILIKDMEMPENCHQCMFGFGGYCDFAVDYEHYCCPDRGRPEWCILIEVPDHGELIDRDALLKDFDSPYRFRTFGGVPVFHEDAIRKAPTIIPES